jgi:hypothetical protein
MPGPEMTLKKAYTSDLRQNVESLAFDIGQLPR